jgi:outer membrane protein, adhesin transport system
VKQGLDFPSLVLLASMIVFIRLSEHFKIRLFCGTSVLRCLVVVYIFLCMGTASAESLSFGKALTRVWQNHPDVRKAEAAVNASGYDKTAAYAGFFPYLQTDMVRGSQSKDDYVVRAVLPLWSGGQTRASVDVAKAAQNMALADLQRTRLQLALRLTDVYFSVLAYKEQDGLWRQYVDKLTNLYGMIQRRATSGVSPQADVMSILSRLRQADASAELNRASLAAAETQLAALLGATTDSLFWPQNALLTPDEISTALARAMVEHPDLTFAAQTITREQADTRMKRAGLSPELSLRYVKPFGADSGNNTSETQIVLQYQSDNGIKAYQAWRSGEQRVDGARAALDTVRLEVTSAINLAKAEISASTAQLGYQSEAVLASDAVIDSFLRQFEAGRKSWLEVLNAQREALDTRMAQVQQRRSLWQANTRLALHGLYWDNLVQDSEHPPTSIIAPEQTP